MRKLVVAAAMISFCACAPQAQVTVKDAPSGSWVLLIPPQRAYAADRSPIMGGPLATQPMEAAESHGAYYTASISQFDVNAPLSQWKNVLSVSLQSKSDCERVKGDLLHESDDPAWLTQQALQTRTRIIDPSRYRDAIEAARCMQQ